MCYVRSFVVSGACPHGGCLLTFSLVCAPGERRHNAPGKSSLFRVKKVTLTKPGLFDKVCPQRRRKYTYGFWTLIFPSISHSTKPTPQRTQKKGRPVFFTNRPFSYAREPLSPPLKNPHFSYLYSDACIPDHDLRQPFFGGLTSRCVHTEPVYAIHTDDDGPLC